VRIEPSRIHVAPPNYHLILLPGQLRLLLGPRVPAGRPAVDPQCSSAARTYGPGVIGMVLAAMRDDGVAGLAAIKRADDALFDSMPRHALERVGVDVAAPACELGPLLARLVCEGAPMSDEPQRHAG